jgi:uncharacterized protein
MNTGKSGKKPKITVDTNIIISAFVFPGATVVKLFDDFLEGRAELGISEDILREFTGVCVRKYNYDPEDAVKITDIIRRCAVIVRPDKTISIISDEPDNRILECAEKFGADYIISGDTHIKELKKYRGIHIITAAEYMKLYR